MTASSSAPLVNLNVRTFYDKLEDQNIHMAGQLARHGSDLRAFYDKIAAQVSMIIIRVSKLAKYLVKSISSLNE